MFEASATRVVLRRGNGVVVRSGISLLVFFFTKMYFSSRRRNTRGACMLVLFWHGNEFTNDVIVDR